MSDPTDRRRVGRRAAVRTIASGVVAAMLTPRDLLALGAPPTTVEPRPPLRIGLVRADGTDAWRSLESGIALGAEEASRAAAMLGRSVALRTGAAHDLLDDGVDALVGLADEGGALGALAETAGVLLVDAGAEPRRATTSAPRGHVFHIAPSEPTTRAALERASGPGELVLWHPALRRFGAAQLNARHRARFHEPMDAQAWAGWMSVKVIWESASRLDTPGGDALAAWLGSPRARFDGHKGRALYFDAESHELRQPLYIVRDGRAGEPGIEEISSIPSARSAER